MSPSRRTVLRIAGTAVTVIVAGCSAIGSDRQTPDGDFAGTDTDSTGTTTDGDSTERTPADGSDAVTPAPSAAERFAVRLHGPDTDQVLFTGADIATVGPVETRTGVPGFTITLTDGARQAVAETFRNAGVAGSPDEFEIVQTSADRSYEVAPGLAASIADGEWDGRLRQTYANESRAEQARDRLVGDDS